MTAKELLLSVPAAIRQGAGTPDAVVQFLTSEPVHCIVKDGAVAASEGVAPAPDVTIRVSDDNLLKLVRGELNPVMAFMMGKVRIEGNMALAQQLLASIDRSKLGS